MDVVVVLDTAGGKVMARVVADGDGRVVDGGGSPYARVPDGRL